MKRMTSFTMIIALVLSMLVLTACGKSEFGLSENTEKKMTITAENADKDSFFMVGSLEVADGEQIAITSNLTKGSVRVEIIGMPAEQSIDQIPDLNVEPTITSNLKSTDSVSGTVAAGTYMLKAACLAKATVAVLVEVTPVS